MRYVRIVLLAVAVAAVPASGGAYPLGNAAAPATAPTKSLRQAAAPSDTLGPLAKTEDKASPAPAEAGAGQILVDSIGILIRLFVLAVILESALAVIFHWRPYLARFDGGAVNSLLTFVAALVLVEAFHLDEVGLLIGRYRTDPGTAPPIAGDLRSAVVTALVIAGGSAGVNRMLQALGYRSISISYDQLKPPRTEAWIAVTDTSRAGTPTDYDVVMKEGTGDWSVLGSIMRGGWRPPLLGWMLRDRQRFPPSGGFAVPIETLIEVGVKERKQGSSPVSIWGPNKVVAGAIVNIPTGKAI